VPFIRELEPVPWSLEPLVELVRSGRLSRV
jgi:hypothetical protein